MKHTAYPTRWSLHRITAEPFAPGPVLVNATAKECRSAFYRLERRENVLGLVMIAMNDFDRRRVLSWEHDRDRCVHWLDYLCRCEDVAHQ